LEKFESWAVVELMGHHVLAGYVTEAEHFGTALLRIDVPADPEDTEARPAFTKYFGAASIYGVTPCSEEFARVARKRTSERPVSVYMPELYSPAGKRPALPPALAEGIDWTDPLHESPYDEDEEE